MRARCGSTPARSRCCFSAVLLVLVVLVLRVVLVALVVSFLLGFLLHGRVRPSLYWRLTPWLLQPRAGASGGAAAAAQGGRLSAPGGASSGGLRARRRGRRAYCRRGPVAAAVGWVAGCGCGSSPQRTAWPSARGVVLSLGLGLVSKADHLRDKVIYRPLGPPLPPPNDGTTGARGGLQGSAEEPRSRLPRHPLAGGRPGVKNA